MLGLGHESAPGGVADQLGAAARATNQCGPAPDESKGFVSQTGALQSAVCQPEALDEPQPWQQRVPGDSQQPIGKGHLRGGVGEAAVGGTGKLARRKHVSFSQEEAKVHGVGSSGKSDGSSSRELA